MNERAIFAAALDHEDPAERAAYLDQACAGDAALRQRVENLLQSHEEAGSFLKPPSQVPQPTRDWPPADAPAPRMHDDGPTAPVGSHLGPYQLLRKLGEGGMGTVWVAEQQEPVKRRVALKLIKPGMDSAQVLRRFEQERQALALMDHGNIARVLDAGTTQSGRPYFVMELVKGVPITKYCDELHLSVRERLELFVPVCAAIQHAHQKGIIHRDVKPSNILVAVQDGRPIPKVIDFGVAKAMHQQLTEQSPYTEIGQVIGTLEYMSPEQAELSTLDIDTRADVYALGVVLYELLTGTTPLDRKRLRQASYAEVLRLIREEEPPKPSTRLTDSTASLAGVAARRRTEPANLKREIRGELDWIVMRCLEKDRTRRYDTPSGLARDLERHLLDEPVEASPQGTGYRLRKLLRKYRVAALTAAAFVALLLVGAAVSTWQAVRATHAEAEALQERDEKETALRVAVTNAIQAKQAKIAAEKAAEAERTAKAEAYRAAAEEHLAKLAAQQRLAQIEKHMDILTSVFRDLDPRREEKDGLPLSQLLATQLDKAAALLHGEAVGDALMVARLQLTLGRTQMYLGYADRAEQLFSKARTTLTNLLGADHPDTLQSMNFLASAYLFAGKSDLALALHRETLEKTKAKLGADHLETLASMNNLALAYLDAGQAGRALPLFVETLEKLKAKLGADAPLTLNIMDHLAAAYQAAGQLDRALPLFVETLEKRQTKLGADHIDTLTSMSHLAVAYRAAGQLDHALPLSVETLDRVKAKLGANHPLTLGCMSKLAVVYKAAGQFDRALPLLVEALEKQKAKLGAEHPDTLTTMNNLAAAYLATRQLDHALPLYLECLEKRQAKLGADHPHTLSSMNNLASAYAAAGKLDLALPLHVQTLEKRKVQLGADHPDTLASMNNLASTYYANGQLDKALPLFVEVWEKLKAKLGPDHPNTLTALHSLAATYYRVQRYADAEAHVMEWLARKKPKLPGDDLTLAAQLNLVGECRVMLKKYVEAEQALRASLAIYEMKKVHLVDRYLTGSLLGAALAGQKKYAEAEPLLIDNAKVLIATAAKVPSVRSVMLDAVQRVIALYEAWDRPDDAAVWRKKLEELPPGSHGA